MNNEAVAERLAMLTQQAGGILTPEAVVKDAMTEDSPLHGLFEWDQSKAAWSHWLDRARQIIRSVRINFRDDTTSVSVVAYARDPNMGDEQGYRQTLSIRSDQELAREVLVQEFGRAAAYLRRARELAVAFSLEAEVEDIQSRLSLLRERIASEARTD
jgi:hypothetical protein